MFRNIIVKRPCRAVVNGIASSPELGKPVYEKAIAQHNAYIEALRACGTKVDILPADEDFPDSCFVEDTAVLTKRCAVLTNPGAPSRRMETASMLPVLRNYFPEDCIEVVRSPGTLEGGDVMQAENHFYVGRSARTNAEGIRQFAAVLHKYGYTVSEVPLRHVLHLKTGVNYIGENTILAAGEFIACPEFEKYRKIAVPPEEAYAANCIRVNDRVLMPEGYPKTEAMLYSAGFDVIAVDTSEFRRIDGGLSCLSLRFTALL